MDTVALPLSLPLLSPSLLANTAGHKAKGQEQNVARQMEGVFIEMMLKSMRATAASGGLINNKTIDMYTGLYDQHLIQEMTAQRSIGVAELIAKQLGSAVSTKEINSVKIRDSVAAKGVDTGSSVEACPVETGMMYRSNLSPKYGLFISQINQAARQASRRSGVPYLVIMAQAALESGWGKQEIFTQEGKPSYNLFGIKSTPHWQGKSTEVVTTEYIDGAAKKHRAFFKVYHSYRDAFEDYINLLSLNPRYKKTLNAMTPEIAAEQLQEAGYATDPHYANKLKSIISRLKISAQEY